MLKSTYVGLQQSIVVIGIDKRLLGIATQFPCCNYTVGPCGSGPTATYLVPILYVLVASKYTSLCIMIIIQAPGIKGHVLLRHMHICTRSIQIYFHIFFPFICVPLSFHCSHIIPIFSEFFPIFLPIPFTLKACHFDTALLILLPFKRTGGRSHGHLG